jgi:hypothetical protein
VEIVVGPEADTEAEVKIRKMLDEFGIDGLRIRHSCARMPS